MGTLNIKSQRGSSSTASHSKISIAPAAINLAPGAIVYDGTEKTQTVNNVTLTLTEGVDYILDGNTAINAGTHVIMALGTNNYKDITTMEWTIQKAASSIIPSVSALNIEDSGNIDTFTITTIGDGTVSVSSSNTAVATATISNNTVTVTSKTEGTATITVTISEGNNYNEASTDIEVTVGLIRVFGVVWNYGNSSTALTRLTSSTDPNGYVNTDILADPVAAVGTGNGSSQFDNYMPWSGMEEYNVADNAITYKKGSSDFSRNNDTVVYIPKFYYKIIKDTTNSKHYFYIADHALTGFEKHPGSEAYVGKYVLDIESGCKSGKIPQRDRTRDGFRQIIKRELGTNWSQWGLHHLNAIQLLYVIEFADWNSQNKIGFGICSGNDQLNSGGTDAMIYHTGKASDVEGNVAVQYRGIENLWGNVEQFVDGVNIMEHVIYYCTNPDNYADDTTTNYTDAGYSLPSIGYITQLGFSPSANWLMLPSAASGGSTSTYIPDLGSSSNGELTLDVGGTALSNASGLFFVSSGKTSLFAHDDWGTRPVFIP